MTISTAPRREIHTLVMPLYPVDIKAHGHELLTVFVNRRGKPVRHLRSMPMACADALAVKLQGRLGATLRVA